MNKIEIKFLNGTIFKKKIKLELKELLKKKARKNSNFFEMAKKWY